MTPRLHELTATQVLELLQNNTVTVETYARGLLDHVKETESIVKAWAFLDPGLVIAQAQTLDQVPVGERGPLHGLAIGVKDIMNSKGKTTTTEFAMTNSGPDTTNPCDPKRTPGGSSCGSAAAVAALHVPLSLGSQTGGSLIRPASFTGVYALKPTFNTISTEGQKAIAPIFDTCGFFARCVEDLKILADVFSIEDDEPARDMLLGEMSIALMKTPMWPTAGPGTISAIEAVTVILRERGIKVEEVSFPPEISDPEELDRLQQVITQAGARISFLREYRIDKDNLAPEICEIVENTARITHKEREQASDRYSHMRRIINALARGYTVILTPSAEDEAPVGLGDMGRATFNTMWTVSVPLYLSVTLQADVLQGFHMPVVNIPAFSGANDMPVGVSLVGPRFRDQQLLTTSLVLARAFRARAPRQLSDPS
ncbi:amidase [Colletotrichum tamarilloi]|uniref:Amidase n=1 Tax=Colletotrichum tamarilloi TaxID=1209934 RepID=A0ABQ9QH95_9PEZI|nr:amidase [Colletotrichum tamarilloi]KAK1470250.1 amidase [Colletotrichum tamarilloi]